MTILGAIIAGGRARRFDGDKGAAHINERALIDHIALALGAQVDDLVIVGREWAGLTAIADRPAPANGPLGGLCAALHHARALGHDYVLCASCDTLPVPDEMAQHLAPAPAVVEGQWLLGYWPAELAGALDDWLGSQEDRSMRGWMRLIGARIVPLPITFVNINTREDLARAQQMLNKAD
ncbi:MAG: molybdenum cofactor guanylyltransferase [Sphingobium sp.]